MQDHPSARQAHPLQNRVDPFGEICATPARGALMGNRGGRLHTPEQRVVRSWVSRRWITCRLTFRDRRRHVMGDSYTELFFMDEATALAAGHRPCFECRRADAKAFAAAWADAEGLETPLRADRMDAILHRERLERRAKRLHQIDYADLPAGAMVLFQGAPWLLREDSMLRWTFNGYAEALPRLRAGRAQVLTPPGTLSALRGGYAPASRFNPVRTNAGGRTV